MQSQPAILTAAICGAETTRAQTPHLPITADELAEEAARCAEAGAAVVHLHVRKDDGAPSQDRALFEKAIRAIRARCDIIVQTSTGGAVGMTAEERAQPLECNPDMATLNAGSLNFGEDVFLNPFPMVREFAARMRARGIVPELECYDVGHVESCLWLAQQGVIDLPAHFDFVMGVRGGIAATEENLRFLLGKLPRAAASTVRGSAASSSPWRSSRCGWEATLAAASRTTSISRRASWRRGRTSSSQSSRSWRARQDAKSRPPRARASSCESRPGPRRTGRRRSC